MPRRSNAVFSENEKREFSSEFYSILNSFSFSQLDSFMNEFLTDEEKVMLSKRFAIFKMLYGNVSLSEIQQILGISHETTRIYNSIKDSKSEHFKKVFLKPIRKAKLTKLASKIEEKLKPLEYALNAKTNMKARAKLLP